MIRLFVGLKLRLLRNTFRSSGGPALLLFCFVVVGLTFASFVYISRTSPGMARWMAPSMTFAVAVGWAFGPIVFGASDETIDTSRLALLPLRGRDLAPGITAASMIGPAPVGVTVALFAFCLHPLAGNAQDTSLMIGALVRAGLIAAAIVATMVFSVVMSRLVLTALGNLLRRRNRRDSATIFAGLAAGLLAVASQLARYLGVDADLVRSGGRVVRWLPGGWSGEAIGQLLRGESIVVPVALIVATLALTRVLARLWTGVLSTALSDVSEGGEVTSIDGHMLQEAAWAWTSWLPASGRASAELLRLVVSKELRYLRRHPRYRIQVVTQGIVLFVGGAPFIAAVADKQPEAVLVGCVPALTAGITSSNLFGADGRALWGEVVALPSLKIVLRGRSLTFAIFGLAASAVVTLATAAWTGGWEFFHVAIGAAVGMALTGAGVGSYTSTLAPVNFPDDSNPNPFATEATGQGFLNALITFGGVLVGLLLAAPILYGLAQARMSPANGIVLLLLAPVYGLAMYLALTSVAGRRADRRAPDLVASLA